MIIISYAKLECLELLGWELGVLITGGIWYTVGNYLKQEADCDGDYNVCQIKKKKKKIWKHYISDFGPHHDGVFFGGNPSF